MAKASRSSGKISSRSLDHDSITKKKMGYYWLSKANFGVKVGKNHRLKQCFAASVGGKIAIFDW